MNQNRKTGTHTLALVISRVLSLCLSMLVAMVLSRTLRLEEYGTYSELMTVSGIGVSLFSLGLPNALNYFLPGYTTEAEKRSFIGFYFSVMTVLALLLAAVMALAGNGIAAYYGNAQLTAYSYVLMLLPWTKMMLASRSNLLIAEGHIMREIAYSGANSFLLALIALLTLWTPVHFDRYLALYAAVECIFAVLVYAEAFFMSGRTAAAPVRWSDIRALFAYSIPLGLSAAVSALSLDLDRLVIGFLSNEAAVAIYANAGRELPFSLIPTAFTAVCFPQMAVMIRAHRYRAAVTRWKQIMVINYFILAFCTSASVVFAPQIIGLLYSDAYLGGVTVFRIYALTLLLRITYWGMLLNAFGRTKEILYNSALCLAVNASLSVLFYHVIGFSGPALATLISIAAIAGLQLLRTSKLLGMPVRSLIPLRRLIPPTSVCMLSGFAAWGVMRLLHAGIDSRGILLAVVIGLLWGGFYLCIFGKTLFAEWKRLNEEMEEDEESVP